MNQARRAYGKTRWRRFFLAFVPAIGLVGGVMIMMSVGALALPVEVDGTVFTATADSLTAHPAASGPSFIQIANVDPTSSGGATAVATTILPGGGTLPNLDQTVCGPTGLPGPLANVKVQFRATSADATGGLVVDVTNLMGGTATFGNLQVGVPYTNPRTGSSTFAQTADTMAITGGLTQHAVYLQAGTFAISGLNLTASFTGGC